MLADHHQLIRAGVAAHGGREVDNQGDGFFIVFPSATACAAAAIEIQQALAAHRWPTGEQVKVRMGMHSGEALESDSGLIGFDVHRAARVAAVGSGGQVLVSETTAALVRDRLPEGSSLRDLGLHRLKDLGRPQQIFQLDAAGLPVDFAPLRTLDHPLLANNLPAQSAEFIGRDRELQEVRELIALARLVTLTGAGGCGKTRLALELAAEALDGSPDGVWMVELAAVAEPDEVAAEVAGALGIRGQPGRGDLDNLLDALAPQDVLIVLDNCEHLIAMCAGVADAILRRCPKVQLLATSREPLGVVGERVYRVPSLSLPSDDEDPAALAQSDAVVLFVERARAQGVELRFDDRSGPALASTCRRLDGMPLAIELAAARLRSLSIFELHELLDERFRLLTGGSRAALERQQTLMATVNWSYSLLNETERALLRRLSVFAGGFDLEAASAVCAFGEVQRFEVTDLLGSLVDKSLVTAEQGAERMRYALLETIRQFAAERLAETDAADAAALVEAHGRYFLELAETASEHLSGPEPGPWFARLDTDQANLRRAIERASEDPGLTPQVVRFAIALGYYWFTRARRREAFELVMPGLARPEAKADPELYLKALVFTVSFATAVDADLARRLWEEAAVLARELGNENLQVWTIMAGSYVRLLAGDREAALAMADEALTRARELDDDQLSAECALAAITCGVDLDLEDALSRAERLGNLLLGHDLHVLAGERALEAGDAAKARAHFTRAAETGREHSAAMQYSAIPLALALRAEGDRDAARSLLLDALRTTRRTGDHPNLAASLLGLAYLAGDRGDWGAAARLHGASQAIIDRIGVSWIYYGRTRQASIEEIRNHLGDQEYERLYAAGHELSQEAAIELALGETPAVASAPSR